MEQTVNKGKNSTEATFLNLLKTSPYCCKKNRSFAFTDKTLAQERNTLQSWYFQQPESLQLNSLMTSFNKLRNLGQTSAWFGLARYTNKNFYKST